MKDRDEYELFNTERIPSRYPSYRPKRGRNPSWCSECFISTTGDGLVRLSIMTDHHGVMWTPQEVDAVIDILKSKRDQALSEADKDAEYERERTWDERHENYSEYLARVHIGGTPA